MAVRTFTVTSELSLYNDKTSGPSQSSLRSPCTMTKPQRLSDKRKPGHIYQRRLIFTHHHRPCVSVSSGAEKWKRNEGRGVIQFFMIIKHFVLKGTDIFHLVGSVIRTSNFSDTGPTLGYLPPITYISVKVGISETSMSVSIHAATQTVAEIKACAGKNSVLASS